MTLFYDFSSQKKRPESPDGLATEALQTANFALDAHRSRVAFERFVQRSVNDPVQQKIIQASRALILTSIVMAVIFIFGNYLEWHISQEIYEVLLPTFALAPFLCSVVLAFYTSICLGESTLQFSLAFSGSDRERGQGSSTSITSRLYGRSEKRPRQLNFFHPVAGLLVAVFWSYVMYQLSQYRVDLLKAAGEVTGWHSVYLPVGAFWLGIFSGIPTYFLALWVYYTLQHRQHRSKLTELRYQELELRTQALRGYQEYLHAHAHFCAWQKQHGEKVEVPLPANKALRELYQQDFGEGGEEVEGDDDDEGQEEAEPEPEVPDDPDTGQPAMARDMTESEENQRIDDLTSLLDEQIAKYNTDL